MNNLGTSGRIAASVLALIMAAGLLVGLAYGFSVGSGDEDWWIDYPDGHADSGTEVAHPQWVLDALGDGPVFIYGHKECSYCAPQEVAIDKLLGQYGDQLEYYDIKADGSDRRAADIAGYDPNGGANYVPLTVIVTLVQGPDGVVVGWHSSEEVTGEDWIRSYMEDALDQYDQNSADWEK